jgi:RNA recognition motif-containing protein
MEEGRKLYVWNLPYSVDWAELKRVFSAAGNGECLIRVIDTKASTGIQDGMTCNQSLWLAVLFANVMIDKAKGVSKVCGDRC